MMQAAATKSKNPPKPQALLIGLDGDTWTALKPGLEQENMPPLKSLIERGASGFLKSAVRAVTPVVWGGFQTGKYPGRTGVFDLSRRNAADKKSCFVKALDAKRNLLRYCAEKPSKNGKGTMDIYKQDGIKKLEQRLRNGVSALNGPCL